MGNKKRSKNIRLNGINPLAYVGVNPYTPPGFHIFQRDPTVNDIHNFTIGDLWLNTQTDPPTAPEIDNLWMLVSLTNNVATWVNFGAGDVETLTGDVGGPVPPDANGNINLFGTAGHITTSGNPATNTITWDLDGSVATQYTADVGVAVPVANNLNVFGDFQIHTTGAADTLTISSESTHAFAARGLVTQANATGADFVVRVNCATELYDFTNDYDTVTSTYTAPVTGLYMFGGNVALINTLGDVFNEGGGCAVRINGSAILFTGGAFSNLSNTSDTVHNVGSAADMVYSLANITTGDVAELVVVISGGTQVIGISHPTLASDFFGYLIQRTA